MQTCARCGKPLDPEDCFIVRSVDSDASAGLCRSEHIVAWVLRGAAWQTERPWEIDSDSLKAAGAVEVVRRRAGEEVVRAFADVDSLRQWASAGAFWGES